MRQQRTVGASYHINPLIGTYQLTEREQAIRKQERTGTPAGNTKFSKHEKEIRLGNQQALLAWWEAAKECVALYESNGSAYARKSVSKDWKQDTIRCYINRIINLMERGHKPSEFKSVEHAWETLGYYSNKSKVEKVETGTRVVNAKTRKAYDALFATAEFRALPAGERALLRKLRDGKAFHTNIG